MIRTINSKIKQYSELFGNNSGNARDIKFHELKEFADGTWFDVNGANIIGNMIGHKYLNFYSKWSKSACVESHQHSDCIETFIVVSGVFVVNDRVILKKGDRRRFYTNEKHKIEAIEAGESIVTIEKVY